MHQVSHIHMLERSYTNHNSFHVIYMLWWDDHDDDDVMSRHALPCVDAIETHLLAIQVFLRKEK